MSSVAPPFITGFGDPVMVAEAAMAVLRLQTGDIDEARLASKARVALAEIAIFLDSDGSTAWPDPLPEPLTDAAVSLTVELYRRKDAPFGVLNAWSPDDIGPVRIAADWLIPIAYQVNPYKQRWGLA